MSDTKRSSKKLLVIGSGIAGLAGGHWAQKAGYEVEIVEASDRPGGRVACFEYDGDRISVGAQYFHTCYRDTIDLIEDMGYGTKHQRLSRGLMVHHSDGSLATRNRFDIQKLLGWGGRLSAAYFGARYLAPGRRFPSHELDSNISAMDNRLASDATRNLDHRFQENVIFPASYSLAQSEPDHTSLLHLVRLMNMQSHEFQIPGGTYTLVEALARTLPIEYENPAKRLVVEKGRVIGAELEDGSVRRADHVFVSLPGGAASALIPDELHEIQKNLTESSYGPVVAPAFFLDRTIEGRIGTYSEMSPQRSFCLALDQKSVTTSGRSALVLLSAYPKNLELIKQSDEEVLKLGLEQLERLVPDFQTSWVTHAAVKRHPFGAPRFPPGQYKRNWELQCLAEDQPGLSLNDPRGAHMEASVRRARVAVALMQAE